MRILLDYRPALRERSGVGEFVHGLTRALAASNEGDALSVLTSSWKHRPAQDLPATLPGVRVVDRRIPVRALTWAWNRLEWPPVEWLAGAIDVAHSPSPLLIPATRAAQVITINDLHFLSHPDRSEGEMRRDYPALVHDHARRADRIVAISRYTAGEAVRQLGVPAERISLCFPGVPAWTREVARERTDISRSAPILFVGTVEPRKNIGGLLDAYTRLRAQRADAPGLILAGRIAKGCAEEIARLDRDPLAGHVTLLGYVTHDERRRLYRQAGMLVLPSFDEGFGLPVLEAMACGVPVVISNRGALPEVAGEAATPVQAEDADAIAAEMARLLEPAAARDAVERGLARASAFTWEAAARSARDAYRLAIAARARRAG